MARFEVWAPHAERVALAWRDRRTPMTRGERGWWTIDVPDATDDEPYAFVLDDGDELPDPRAPRLPDGVHARARRVRHDAFEWADDGFRAPPLAGAVLYDLHVGTFTPAGTFDGAIERLDHLRTLGVTHVELLPVNAFDGTHGWGYDGVGLYAPFEPYGGPDGLKRLVDACHARGLGVVLDVVYNHLGPSGNYLGRFGPYFTDHYRTPWGDAVNYDGRGSDEVRRFVIDNAVGWVRDYHVDALRLDAVHAIYDFGAQHLLEELTREVHAAGAALGKHVDVIAESDLNDPRLLNATQAGGYGLDAQWSDDFHHALHSVLTGERHGYYEDFGSIAELARVMERGYAYDGRYSPHRGRRHGRRPVDLDGTRFVVFLQNHDQVGNRARGERIAHLVSPARARVGAALLLTSPFVPMLFQGEEWGATAPFQYFTAHVDEALAEAVRAGRQREFAAFAWQGEVPDPQAPETFARSKLDWSELGREPHASLLRWHRDLIALRRRVADLADPRLDRTRVTFDEDARWLVVERGAVAVAANLGSSPQAVPVRAPRRRVLLASDGAARVEGDRVRLAPDSVAILSAPHVDGD
jgi:maltooligosyltrehalose trehalohydrolase